MQRGVACRKWSGPGCQRSRSPVSASTECHEGWPCEAQRGDGGERPGRRAPSSGTRHTAERSVIGSWRTLNSLRVGEQDRGQAPGEHGLLEIEALQQVEQRRARAAATIAACQARRRRRRGTGRRAAARRRPAAPGRGTAGSPRPARSRAADGRASGCSGVSAEAMLTSPTSAAATAIARGSQRWVWVRAAVIAKGGQGDRSPRAWSVAPGEPSLSTAGPAAGYGAGASTAPSVRVERSSANRCSTSLRRPTRSLLELLELLLAGAHSASWVSMCPQRLLEDLLAGGRGSSVAWYSRRSSARALSASSSCESCSSESPSRSRRRTISSTRSTSASS